MSKNDKDRDRKCREIVEAIRDLCNKQYGIGILFTQDWGDNSLTILRADEHWHVGSPDATFENLVDHMHAVLTRAQEAKQQP